MADVYDAAGSTPSLPYARSFVASEAVLLTGAVFVLGLALLMLGRMFRALSTPTKTMVVMVTANLGGAVVNLLQAYYQLAFIARGRYVPEGDAFCRYSQPVFRGFQAVTWWGQLLLAWATWDTIRGGKRVGPRTLAWRIYGVSFIIGAAVIAGMAAQAPGEVLWGLFCVTPFMMPNESKADVRYAFALLCDVTLALSCLLYGTSYWRLRRVGRSLQNRQQQQQQPGGTPRGGFEGTFILPPSPAALQAQQQQAQQQQAQQQQAQQQQAQQQQEPPSTPQSRRLHRASKALLQRSTLLLVTYYVPYILVHTGMAKLQMADHSVRHNDGPQELQMSLFFLGYVFGQPVLQSFIFIYTAVIIGNNLLGSFTTSLKRVGRRKGGPGTKGARSGRRRRRRRGPPSTANRDSQQSTPERHDRQATTGVDTSGLPPPSFHGQGQEQQLAPSLQASLPGVSVVVGHPTQAPPGSVLLAPAPAPVVGGAPHAHLEAGHPQWRHAPGRRWFYDAQGAMMPRRSCERVPMLATIYEVTFRKGRAARRMRAAVAAAGGGGVGTGTGGAGTATAPDSSSLKRGATPTPEEASLVEENLGSEEVQVGSDEEEYDTEDDYDDEDEDDGIRYEEEETSRASSRFDDAGRSVVFDDDDDAYDEERAQNRRA